MGWFGTVAAWPLAVRTEQRIPRIGYLSPVPADWHKDGIAAFEAGLGDLGYVLGETIEIEFRYSDGQEDQMAELARELVDLKVDVIVTEGTGVYAAHNVTNTVPIVAAVTGDLVALTVSPTISAIPAATSPDRPSSSVNCL